MRKLIWMIIDVYRAVKERRKHNERNKKKEAFLRTILEDDLKCMSDDPVAKQLIERYLKATSEYWYKEKFLMGPVLRASIVEIVGKK